MTKTLLLLPAFLLLSPLLRADILDFTLNGEGSTYTFQGPSNPMPTGSNNTGFTIANLIITLNGQELAAEVAFFNADTGGGMDFVRDIPHLTGQQLYSLDQSTITFLTGTFGLINSQDGSPYTLTVATDQPMNTVPVPEPITILLAFTGIAATAMLNKRRFGLFFGNSPKQVFSAMFSSATVCLFRKPPTGSSSTSRTSDAEDECVFFADLVRMTLKLEAHGGLQSSVRGKMKQ